jgi:hypothetical protein
VPAFVLGLALFFLLALAAPSMATEVQQRNADQCQGSSVTSITITAWAARRECTGSCFTYSLACRNGKSYTMKSVYSPLATDSEIALYGWSPLLEIACVGLIIIYALVSFVGNKSEKVASANVLLGGYLALGLWLLHVHVEYPPYSPWVQTRDTLFNSYFVGAAVITFIVLNAPGVLRGIFNLHVDLMRGMQQVADLRHVVGTEGKTGYHNREQQVALAEREEWKAKYGLEATHHFKEMNFMLGSARKAGDIAAVVDLYPNRVPPALEAASEEAEGKDGDLERLLGLKEQAQQYWRSAMARADEVQAASIKEVIQKIDGEIERLYRKRATG